MSNFEYENLSLEPINGSNRLIINNFVKRCKSNNLEGIFIPRELQQPVLDNLTIEDASISIEALDHLLSGGGCKSLNLSKHHFESESTAEFSQVLSRALNHLEKLNIINHKYQYCQPNCPMSEFFLNSLDKNAVPVNLKCLEICCVKTASEIMSILKYCPSLNKLKIRNITLNYDQLSLVNSQLHEDQFTKIQRSLTHLDINSDKIPFEDDDKYENDIMELEVLCEFITLFKELQYLNLNSFFEPILNFMRRITELNLDDSFTDLSVVINFENFLENLNGIGLNFIECKSYNLYRLAQMAPNIKELKIKTLGQISLLVIEKFECLKELSIEPLCCFNNQSPTIIADFQSLIPALTERGSNMTHLSLMNVDDIDLNRIAALCPNLIHLELDLNGYPSPVKLLKVSKKQKRENFTKLRKFHLKSSGVDLLNYLYFVLKSALQITTLQVESNHGNDVDDYLSAILKYNPMVNLEYFRLISGSSCIDSYEIRKLFLTPEQFPNLRYFNIKFIDPCLECGRTHELGEPEHCECPFNGYDENCPNHISLDPEVHRVQL